MSIDKNRGDFMAVLVIALLAIAAGLPTPLTFASCLIIIACGVILYQQPNRRAGYALGGLAVVSGGVAGAAALGALWEEPPAVATLLAIVGVGLLTAAGLVWSWNSRMPVRFGQQVNINTIFGMRKIRGPTRTRRPAAWLGGRVISSISLRQIKSSIRVEEVDVRPAAATGPTLRVIRPDTVDLAGAPGPTKIHAVELSISYAIDGDRWFMLYNVPHYEEHATALGRHVGRDRPEYWEAVATGYIGEEADEVLRRVVQREGWSATVVRDQRGPVAARLLAELGEAAAQVGIAIQQVELLTVDVDTPEALRAARNSGVLGQEAAEHRARLGGVQVSLQRDSLALMRELLADPELQLSSDAVAAIARAQIRALAPATNVEDILEEALLYPPPPYRRGEPAPQHRRDAA